MKHVVVVALATLLLAAGGCKETQEPVGRLTVEPTEITLPHGVRVPVQATLETTRELDAVAAQPILFVHLLDPAGDVVRTFDQPVGARLTPGQEVGVDLAVAQSVIGPALPAGDYRLTMGLYDGAERRWALTTQGEEVARQEYAVARVRVPELSPDAPRFAFSPEWQAVEAGGDKQAVARRWLSGDGSLEVQALPVPAALWMTLRIPTGEAPMRIMLEEGAATPAVRVATDCSGFAATITGEGFHDLTVPVATVPCRITFDANFTALGRDPGRKLSVSLEQLAWREGAVAGAAAQPAPAAAEGGEAASADSAAAGAEASAGAATPAPVGSPAP